MPILTEIEKKHFIIRSFEKKWGLPTPNLKVKEVNGEYIAEGKPVQLSPDKVKTLLGFEGLESIQPLMEKAFCIEKRLTHQPLSIIITFYQDKVSIKKNLNRCVTSNLENMEETFFGLMKQCGVPELEKRALDYETNFVFETTETKRERKELLQHFNYLTINWIKEIEEAMQKDFTKTLSLN